LPPFLSYRRNHSDMGGTLKSFIVNDGQLQPQTQTQTVVISNEEKAKRRYCGYSGSTTLCSDAFVVHTRKYTPLGSLAVFEGASISTAFVDHVLRLPDEFNNKHRREFEVFFHVFGTHVVCQAFIGGYVQMTSFVNKVRNRTQMLAELKRKFQQSLSTRQTTNPTSPANQSQGGSTSTETPKPQDQGGLGSSFKENYSVLSTDFYLSPSDPSDPHLTDENIGQYASSTMWKEECEKNPVLLRDLDSIQLARISKYVLLCPQTAQTTYVHLLARQRAIDQAITAYLDDYLPSSVCILS